MPIINSATAPVTTQIERLVDTILEVEPSECGLPTPLSDEDFYNLARDRFKASADWIARHQAAAAAPPSTARTTDAGRTGAAVDSRALFQRELRAAVTAVRQGLVLPADALERLKQSFPELTHTLGLKDLR